MSCESWPTADGDFRADGMGDSPMHGGGMPPDRGMLMDYDDGKGKKGARKGRQASFQNGSAGGRSPGGRVHGPKN